jgi:diguanylate cyclase (GGDEF)-like protein
VDKKTEFNKLFDILNNKSFSSKFISGIAGDRDFDNEEKIIFEKILKESGDDFYVKLLFFITHQIFSSEKAKNIWNAILIHKQNISKVLERNIAISVATLDYLTNIQDEIKDPKIIGEAFIGKIAEISSLDSLTKLYNRQYFILKIKEELIRYKRYSIPFSIIMIDIDDFKRVNDTHGHQKGDTVLIEIADLLIKNKRELDTIGRYGGEEFIVLLPHTDKKEAFILAERIRYSVEKYFLANMNITISLGISYCPESGVDLNNIIKKADDALYESKRLGKNKITSK